MGSPHSGYKTTWYNTFLGVRQQHSNTMYTHTDTILEVNPQIKRFVELGTGGGAMSVILALHAVQRGHHLLTFDKQIRGHLPKVDAVFKSLGVDFVMEDHFKNQRRIQEFMDDKPTFFFCDGGDKKSEVKMFAPLLPSGSIIAVHDYGDEILPEDMPDLMEGYEPVFEELWLDRKYELYTCFYKKL